ncbi:MAG: R2-like ligand-binding oxidase [Actinobacteria bacterium]|nr:MAG: R2-like ligand-binding oxidase [Actinomycetota bacterium]
MTERDGFATLRAGGLDWDALPLRLWRKGNALFWNAADIDLTQEADGWRTLSGPDVEAASRLSAMFLAGEEAVTHDIQPFLAAMAAEGRLGDEMYLAQFCFEEARHTEAFRLWFDAVGETGDLTPLVADNPGYRAIFLDALPSALSALADDPSPANQLRASVVYNHIVEGVLALTGYHAWEQVCRDRGILPGMQTIIRRIGVDERRHMAWGTYTCRRHVAADPALWQVVEQTMAEMLPLALSAIEFLSLYDRPLGLDVQDFVAYAAERAQRRLGAIAAAQTGGSAAVEADLSPIALEDELAGDADPA